MLDTGIWTPGQAYAMLACRMTAAALTVLGSIFIIFCIIYFKRYKSLGFRLIFFLALSSLVTGTINLINPANYITAICWIQGMVMQFSQMATFHWTCAIATNVFFVVVLEYDYKETKALEKYYHIAVWTSTFVFFTIPLLTLNYGPAGLWCWITDRAFGRYWRFLCFYLPLYCYIIWIFIAYFSIILKITCTKKLIGEKKWQVIIRLAIYPIVFVLIWICPIINRAQNWLYPDEPIFVLYLLHAITAPSQGFINAIVYGLTDIMLDSIRDKCCPCLPKSKPVDSDDTMVTVTT